MTRDEARAEIVETLLEKIREDRFPSATQMAILEEVMPREMIPEYLDVLLDKIAEHTVPSIPMLRRIQRVADRLARRGRDDRDRRDRPGRSDLDPAIAVAERHVGALLETERADVELDRPLLVGDRDADGRDLADARCGGAHGSS